MHNVVVTLCNFVLILKLRQQIIFVVFNNNQ